MSRPKLLVVADSPTLSTGFARVSRSLIEQWLPHYDIYCWGIGYEGYPHGLPITIYPAGTPAMPDWRDRRNTERLGLHLEMDDVGGTPGGFDQVWIMQDLFLLGDLAQLIPQLARRGKMKIALYFPVDAALEPEWLEILRAVDDAVPYTSYGYDEVISTKVHDPSFKVPKELSAEIEKLHLREPIPHGVNGLIFHPLPAEKAHGFRRKLFPDVAGRDLMLVNVSTHSRRKGLLHSLEVLAHIQEIFRGLRNGPAARLCFHTPVESADDGTNLLLAAAQLGLRGGRDVRFSGQFKNHHALAGDDVLNVILNACGMMLSTSHGEGWGLPLTEAMAVGLPVAAPHHTSIKEILADRRGILLPNSGKVMLPYDNSRVRPVVDPKRAAELIANAWLADPAEAESARSYAVRAQEWVAGLCWKEIAQRWLQLFNPVS